MDRGLMDAPGGPVLDAVIVAPGDAWRRRMGGLSLLRRLALTARTLHPQRILVIADDVSSARLELQDLPEAVAVAPLSATPEIEVSSRAEQVLLLHTDIVIEPRALTEMAAAAREQGLGAGLAAEAPFIWPPHPMGAAIVPGTMLRGIDGAFDAMVFMLDLLDEGRARPWRSQRGYVGWAGALPPNLWGLIRAAGKDSDGLVSRAINRRVSALATRLLIDTPVTPNAVTFALLFLGLATGALMLTGTHAAFVWGSLLFQINSALDGCDGELARVRFQTSRFGAWADNVCDQVVNLAYFAAAPIGLYVRTGQRLHLWLAAFVIGGILAMIPVVYLRSKRAGSAEDFSDFGASIVRGLPERSFMARIAAVLSKLLRRDAYVLVFLLLALLGLDEAIVWLLAAGVAVHMIALLIPTSQPPVRRAHVVG
jgi:phosphatidylglycerophosphate synthase